jgi:hypothetical protein
MIAAQVEPQEVELDLRLQRRQGAALLTKATEVLYGGAAFGGKSHLLRVAAIVWCTMIAGLQVYLFRRTFDDLYKNHVEGPTGFPAMLAPWFETGGARFIPSHNRIEIGDSRIHLCHCEHENDVYKYQGAEIHVLMPDELTQFTDPQYRFLRSRVRMVGIELPTELQGLFPRILAPSNPGGIGHNWVRATWVDPHPPMEIWCAPDEEGGMLRQFVPALMSDNPIGMAADPSYAKRLSGLGSPELVRAMREGDWNIVAGGALDDLWDSERHVLAPFTIPRDWRIDRAFDWGSSKPFSVGWFAETNGEAVEIAPGQRLHLPARSVIQIGELYGWNGKPNEGCRKVATEIGREILAAENEMELTGRVVPGPADSAIFATENGTSIADDMARVGVRWEESEKGPGSRKTGLERMRRMLKASLATPREEPGLYFFDTCRHSLRTLPTLPRDSRKSDDVDTNAEDHAYDQIRYRVMRSQKTGGAVSSIGLIGV